jgi:putative hydrolase of the HAD superfamily
MASNFDERLHGVCRGLKELAGITRHIVSSEIGWRKPARPFFEIVCRETKCQPEEVLFVGDDPQNDIRGANLAGMPAVWINRSVDPPGAIAVSDRLSPDSECWRIRSLRELIEPQV